MFGAQTFAHADDINPRKRGREDDGEDVVFGNGPLSFQEHRTKQKRIQHVPLPLRSAYAPRPPQPRHTTTTTSANAWDSRLSTVAGPGSSSSPTTPTPEYHVGHDMEMDMDPRLSVGPMQADSPLENPHHAAALAGRIPTPIQPTFANHHLQDRSIAGQMVGAMSMGTIDTSSVPRSMEGGEWAQTRRLPSPISEGGADCPMSPNMMLDSAANTHGQDSHTDQCMDVFPHGVESDMTSTMMATDDLDGAIPGESGDGTSIASGSSPPRKGHTRSRHTLNSWTCKPGMQRSFSIGYRSDCEKCRLKVPGHFNHIIIS